MIRLLGWIGVLCLVAGGGALTAHVVDSGALGGAETASAESPGWEFAEPALTGLAAIALQACTGEALIAGSQDAAAKEALDARRLQLEGEYERQAGEYRAEVAAVVSEGRPRPWDVPASPVSFATSKERMCARPPAPPPPPAAVIAHELPAGVTVLSSEQLDVAAAAAGWPTADGWWPQMKQIIYCESGNNTHAYNASDPNGGSYGLAQLNGSQHFDHAGEDFSQRFDPVVNLRTALWLRTVRGHFGGGGGWKNCSTKLGID